jgi:uncharacterized protein (DUF934 family)
MPRRLLRDRRVEVDDWLYAAEATDQPGAAVILTLPQWRQEQAGWLARGSRLGVVLTPADSVALIAQDLPHFSLVAAEFSGPAEGRGYTQARQLREHYNFRGELRAIGYVKRDQLFFMARCGFNSFEVAESDIDDALSAFATFTAAYQPSNDSGLARPLPAPLRESAAPG